MKGYVVEIASRPYEGGFGYAGPSCRLARVKPGAVYDAEYKAALAAQSLSEVSNLTFRVHRFRILGGSPCLSSSTFR